MLDFLLDPIWLFCALVLFLGCVLQTALGFGMAVLSAPIIVFIRPDYVPYVLTSTALIISLANAHDLRTHVQLRALTPAFISRIPGTLVGVYLLLIINVMWLQIIVATSVLIAVGVSLFALHFRTTPARLAWAGFISGLMGTTTSIGGPPMALVMQFDLPERVRANLAVYFAYSCILSLVSYAVSGLLTLEILLACLSFALPGLAGFAAGRHLQRHVSQQRFRPLLLAVCAVSASTAIAGVLYKL